jgi:hypothetical protein
MMFSNVETSKVIPYPVTIGSKKMTLVDTPGFDDTFQTDMDVLDKIADWLEETYEKKRLLTGILYLHSIEKPRMEGAAMRSVTMFKNLCGEGAFPSVILGTTFWDRVSPSVGDQRLKELVTKTEFWGGMVSQGSSAEKMSRDSGACGRLLLRMANNRKRPLQIQEEMALQGKDVTQTSAGTYVDEGLADFIKEEKGRLAEADRASKRKLAQREKDNRQTLDTERMQSRRAWEEELKEQDKRVRRAEATIRTERSGYVATKVQAQMNHVNKMWRRGIIPRKIGATPVSWCDCCLEIFGNESFYGGCILNLGLVILCVS